MSINYGQGPIVVANGHVYPLTEFQSCYGDAILPGHVLVFVRSITETYSHLPVPVPVLGRVFLRDVVGTKIQWSKMGISLAKVKLINYLLNIH